MKEVHQIGHFYSETRISTGAALIHNFINLIKYERWFEEKFTTTFGLLKSNDMLHLNQDHTNPFVVGNEISSRINRYTVGIR